MHEVAHRNQAQAQHQATYQANGVHHQAVGRDGRGRRRSRRENIEIGRGPSLFNVKLQFLVQQHQVRFLEQLQWPLQAGLLRSLGGQLLQGTGELGLLRVQLVQAAAQQALVLLQQAPDAAACECHFGLLGLHCFRFVGVGAAQAAQVPLQAVQLVQLLVEHGVFDGGQRRNALLHRLPFVAGELVLAGHARHFVQQHRFLVQLQPFRFQLLHLFAEHRHFRFHVVGARALHKFLQVVFGVLQVFAVFLRNHVQEPQLLAGSFRFAGHLLFQVHRIYLVHDVLGFPRVEVAERNANGVGLRIHNFDGQVLIQVPVNRNIVLNSEVVAFFQRLWCEVGGGHHPQG